jgi:Uma2 family endonuclease
MVPGNSTRHQIVSLKIAAALLLYAHPGNLGQVLQAPCDVILSREHIVQPDILFVERERTGLIGRTSLWGTPDIAIEILSHNTREEDIRTKRSIYSRFEVKEYWVVDPDSKTIEVLVWSELGYATAGVYGTSQRLSSPALPKLRLPLSRVFA